MSFLPKEKDSQFFVPDILAMLDFDEANWPASTMHEAPLELKPSKVHPRPDNAETEPKSNKRKKPATPRLRNKGKIELLRREIELLEAEVETLQRSKQMATIPQHTCKTCNVVEPGWKAIASRQRQERERALRCNESLKRMLHEQQMLTMALSRVLGEWSQLIMPSSINCD